MIVRHRSRVSCISRVLHYDRVVVLRLLLIRYLVNEFRIFYCKLVDFTRLWTAKLEG